MIIVSASVDRNGATVNNLGQLNTFSTVEPEDKTENRLGKAWTASISVTPAGANDYFFYFENTGTVDYSLTHIRAFSAALTKISVQRVTGTPSYTSATDITPINRNLRFTAGMQATIKQDTDTTGISGDEIYFLQLDTANETRLLAPSSEIIIPPGGQLAFLSTVSTAITATVSLAELI